VLAGQEPGWRSALLPASKAALEASLSAEFLAVMADPAFHQLRAPLTYAYSPGAGESGGTGNDGTGNEQPFSHAGGVECSVFGAGTPVPPPPPPAPPLHSEERSHDGAHQRGPCVGSAPWPPARPARASAGCQLTARDAPAVRHGGVGDVSGRFSHRRVHVGQYAGQLLRLPGTPACPAPIDT
jgi:hypothetical protein